MGVVCEEYPDIIVLRFFCIHFLILQSAVCSPLSEKYYIIKIIAIIIINIQTTKVMFPNQQQETLLWVELVYHLSFHETLLGKNEQ